MLNLEIYLKAKRLELLLRRIVNGKQKSCVSAFMERLVEYVNSKNKHLALNFLIKGTFQRKALASVDAGFRAISMCSKQKKTVNYEFEDIDAFVTIKLQKNLNETISDLAVFGHMKSLYAKKYEDRKELEEDQIIQMMRDFAAKPKLYIPIIHKDRGLKRIILFAKVVGDLLNENQKNKYNGPFFKALKRNKELQLKAIESAKKLDKVTRYLILKQKNHIFSYLRYSRIERRNPRSAFMLLQILVQNRKKYHFNQFYYLTTFKKRGMRPNISNTKSLSFHKRPKTYSNKLFIILQNHQYKKLKAAFLLMKMVQRKPKKQKKNLKVVYGKINTLKMPRMNINIPSQRISTIRGGSQDFDNHTYNPRKLSRTVYGKF